MRLADFILRDVMAVEIPGRPVRLPPSSAVLVPC